MAIQTHPDRPSGSKQKFQLITQCYLSLMEKYKLRESDKTYNDLRQASKDIFLINNLRIIIKFQLKLVKHLIKRILMLNYLINYMNNINYGILMMMDIKTGCLQLGMNQIYSII